MPPVIPYISDHYPSPLGWGLLGSGVLLGLIIESGQGKVALETFLTMAVAGTFEYIQILEGQDYCLREP